MIPEKQKTAADGSRCSSVYESGYSYRCGHRRWNQALLLPLPALPGRSQDQTKPCCSSPCFTRTISRLNQALLLLSLLYQNDLKTKPSPAAPLPALPERSQDQTLLLLSLLYQDDLKTKPSPAAPLPASTGRLSRHKRALAAPLPALPGRSQDQTKPCCSSPCFTRTISRPNQALLLLSLLYQNDLRTISRPNPAAPLPALPEWSQDQTKPCCSSPCFTRTISRLNQALLLLSLLYQTISRPNQALLLLPALPERSQDQTKPCCSSPCFTRTISRPNQALLLLSLLYQDDLKTKPSPAAPLPALPGQSQD